MSNHVTLLQDLRAGKECNEEAVAAIEDLELQLAKANSLLNRWINHQTSSGIQETVADLMAASSDHLGN